MCRKKYFVHLIIDAIVSHLFSLMVVTLVNVNFTDGG